MVVYLLVQRDYSRRPKSDSMRNVIGGILELNDIKHEIISGAEAFKYSVFSESDVNRFMEISVDGKLSENVKNAIRPCADIIELPASQGEGIPREMAVRGMRFAILYACKRWMELYSHRAEEVNSSDPQVRVKFNGDREKFYAKALEELRAEAEESEIPNPVS